VVGRPRRHEADQADNRQGEGGNSGGQEKIPVEAG
jgi:hypothetical protein